MNQFLISIGTSLGDKVDNLKKALNYIQSSIGSIQACSDIYKSLPVGGVAKNIFYNISTIVETSFNPYEMLLALEEIEEKMGRKRLIRWEDRIIDLDIILYKNDQGISLAIESKVIDIPHPRMDERSFVLLPSLQIASEWIHPVYGKKLKELYSKDSILVNEKEEGFIEGVELL